MRRSQWCEHLLGTRDPYPTTWPPPRWSEERVTMMTEAATRRTPGAPCWVSLMAHGLAATQEFYGGLFGWEFRPGPSISGPYVRAVLDGREVAGIGELAPGRHLPVAWTTYLATDDADATRRADPRLRRHGGGRPAGRGRRRGGWPIAVRPARRGLRRLAGADRMTGDRGRRRAGHPGVERTGDPGDRSVGSSTSPSSASRREAVVSADFDYLTLHLDGRAGGRHPRRGARRCRATGGRTG